MPKQSRRNRNKTTKTTVKTIKVKAGSVSWDILPKDLDDFKYYLSKCEKIQLAVSTYKIIAKQGIPEAPKDHKDDNKFFKTASICSAHKLYKEALDTYKTLFKTVVAHQHKVDDKEKQILICCAKRCETNANLYIYLHNKNYDKCLEYYSKLQKLFNEQLDIMMFDDLSHLGMTTRKNNGVILDISQDESVRGFADFFKAQNSNIEILWTTFFHENPPTIALE